MALYSFRCASVVFHNASRLPTGSQNTLHLYIALHESFLADPLSEKHSQDCQTGFGPRQFQWMHVD